MWVESDIQYDVDRCVQVAGTRLELRSYANVPPGRTVTTVKRATIGMLLSARPIQARYPDGFGVSAFHQVGGVIFRPTGVPWEVISEGGPVRTMVCTFDRDRFEQLSGRTTEWSPAELTAILHLRDAEVVRSLRTLEREIMMPGFAAEVLIDATASCLAVQIARHLSGTRDGSARAPGTLSQRQLRAIESCLIETTGPPPTANDLAEVCGVSGRQLLRLFRQTTGRTVSAYITAIQLEKAKRMLTESDLPLKEISYRLGFSAHSNFTHAFRRETGEAPSAFRRRHH